MFVCPEISYVLDTSTLYHIIVSHNLCYCKIIFYWHNFRNLNTVISASIANCRPVDLRNEMFYDVTVARKKKGLREGLTT